MAREESALGGSWVGIFTSFIAVLTDRARLDSASRRYHRTAVSSMVTAPASTIATVPVLDGNGPTARAIPKAYTPGCGYTRFPMPVLSECREPLAEGVQDLRGLWQAYSGLRAMSSASNNVAIV